MKNYPRSHAQQISLWFLICLLVVVGAVNPAHAQTETVIDTTSLTYAGVIFDTAGNLYGVTNNGGSSTNCVSGCGTVFELSPVGDGTWTQTVIYNFQNGSDGGNPRGGLVFDAAGNLYGTNQGGAAYNAGVAYELSPGSGGAWTFTTLYNFGQTSSAYAPVTPLILDSAGSLYGVTPFGGKYRQGTAFKLVQTAGVWKLNVLHSFGGTGDGADPNGPLVMDAQGNLYGTTLSGGADTWGIVYELSHQPNGLWTETPLYTFASGGSPEAGLIFDSAHNLYGATSTGGAHGAGGVYRLTRINRNGQLVWKYIQLYSFTAGADGSNPASLLTSDGKGSLYGTTDDRGPTGCNISYGCGQVYKISVGSNGLWSLAAVYPIPNSIDPQGSLVLDSSGNIYGAAYDNHNLAYGEVFEVE